MRVVVVGAGIAGLACARELADAGVTVQVRERSRVVGGRLASRRFDGRYVDLGAAYVTADDLPFAGLLRHWQQAGLARPWTDTLRVHDRSEQPHASSGPLRWAAPGGLRSLAEDLGGGLTVALQDEVPRLPDADVVVLAMPGPQALRLSPPAGVADAARAQRWNPVLAAVLRYDDRHWGDFAGAFVNDHPVLATVCDDGDRRGDRAPVLVAHSTDGFAREHLEDPAAAGPVLRDAVAELLDIPATPQVYVHRWTYAQPEPGEDGPFHRDGRVFLVGDAFGRPRVQTAWSSGRAAARAIIDG